LPKFAAGANTGGCELTGSDYGGRGSWGELGKWNSIKSNKNEKYSST